MYKKISLITFIFILITYGLAFSQGNDYPDPETNPESSLMLTGDWVPENTHDIDFFNLPKVPSIHSVVDDVRYAWGRKTQQHNYLVHYGGYFWAMWSDGPGVSRSDDPIAHRNIIPGHDQPGQLVSYSKSKDGINWSEPRDLAGPPDDGFGWIARGFWVYDGKLLALATRFNAPNYRGKGLQLHAFEMVTEQEREWKHKGLVFDNAMNNFSPKKIPTGEWMMTRRDSVGDVYMLVGAENGFNSWESYPVIGYQDGELHAEEPYWFVLPNDNLVAFFRDNRGSGYLFRAFSTDNGRTWTRPVRTNFPDARSKFSGLRLSDGRYILVSNSNPEKRDPMTIAISDDGMVFHTMGFLVGNRLIDYPHVIEHDGHIYVAFNSAKQSVEVLKIKISDLDNL
jgi:hypothetical protein